MGLVADAASSTVPIRLYPAFIIIYYGVSIQVAAEYITHPSEKEL